MFHFKAKAKFFYIIFVIFLWSLYFFVSYQNFKSQKISTQIEIKKGSWILSVKNQLCKDKVLKNCLFADIYFYFNATDKIIPGNYTFSWQTLQEIFKQLQKWPPIEYVKFTILPGWTKFDIAENLNPQQKKVFLNLISDKNFITKMKKQYHLEKFWNIPSLEGFLYPDTYFFKPEDLKSILFPQLLIKTAIKNFYQKTKNLSWENPYNLSPYQVLIIASIVEKEAAKSGNKPYIADILIRRYLNHRKIWADWTLCYGLKVTSKDCKNYLYHKYLIDKKNPYNTRANIWLPPSCVSNPTLDTIQAVLKPKKNNYWYYLHDANWNIHFAKNNYEHIQNKNKFLR